MFFKLDIVWYYISITIKINKEKQKMATSEQVRILDKIQKEKQYAKAHHINVAEHLSGGQRKYKTAIRTMMTVGNLSVLVSILAFVAIAFLSLYSQDWGYIPTSTMIYWGVEFAVLLTTGILGYKLSEVDVTPTFALVSLLIILVSNLFLYSGIFPLITVATAIVGLVCWGTFRNWFYDIDTKSNKKRK